MSLNPEMTMFFSELSIVFEISILWAREKSFTFVSAQCEYK